MDPHHAAVELPGPTSGSTVTSVKLTNGGSSVEYHSSQEGTATTWCSAQGSGSQPPQSPQQRRTQSQPEQGQYITLQQLQQFWLRRQGMQRSLDELASYVDHIASTSAKSALALQQATWEEKQQLELVVKQQSARLQQQAAQLEVLRGLAQQQLPPLPPPLAGSSSSSSAALWQDARLQQQLEWHKQEVAAWYKKCSVETAARLVAESALHNTLVIVEQLEEECAGISGMLKDVVDVEAAATAAAEADKKRWKPLQSLKSSRLWVFIQLAVAICVIGCAGVASAYIALGIKA